MKTSKVKPKVNIVVCVYNGEKTLPACLDSLLALDFSKEDLEIVIVDNNSTDATKDIINRYPVKYVFEPKRGRACARNRGIKESQGEIIAFTDADCCVDKNWLKNLLSGFSNNVIGGCSGKLFSQKPQTLIEKHIDSKNLSLEKDGIWQQDTLIPMFATANSAFRRKALEDAGLFDCYFHNLEDVDLSCRIYLKGCQSIYIPQAVAEFKHHNNYIDFFKHHFGQGEASIYLLKKYTKIFKKPLLAFSDLREFLYKQYKSLGRFFITLFKATDPLERIFPVFDMLEDTMVLLGKIYGWVKLNLKIISIIPLDNPDNLFWQRGCRQVIISEPKGDFYYAFNKIGAKIWTLLKEKKDISEIANIIQEEYGTNRKEAEKDIISFMAELQKEVLIPK